MALFQRKSNLSDPVQMMYSVSGLHKTIMLVGLGNPGKEYDGTRHNIGFAVLDALVAKAEELGDWSDKSSLKCQMVMGQMGQTKVIAIKPQTFMNNSGEAVQAVAAYYKVPPTSIVLIHDELDVKFGSIRTRTGGSSAGHNGVKSVTQHLGEETGRIRIGIGPKKPVQMDSSDFVLATFSAAEQKQLPNLYRETNAILSEYIYGSKLATETRSFLV